MKRIVYHSMTMSIALSALLYGQAWSAGGDGNSARPAHIEGRIEETANPQARLPIKLTKLKAEQPILDTTPAPPPPVLHGGVEQKEVTQAGNLSPMQPESDHQAASPLQGSAGELAGEISRESFSPDMMGFWAGRLTIVSEYHKPELSVDPERQQGQSGVAIFHFIQDGANVHLKPATVFLPPIIKALKDTRMRPETYEALEEKAEARGRPVDPEQMVMRNPIISLGNYCWVKLDGSRRTSTVTANSIHTLGPGVAEQDMVDRLETQSADRRDTSGYAEVVCRFTQSGAQSHFVQVAQIYYADDRSIDRRMLLEGTLTRDWQAYADFICRQLRRPWDVIVQSHDL
jgi:hypothetical protein